MRRWLGALLCGLVLLPVGAVPVYAADYTLISESMLEDQAAAEDSLSSVNDWLSQIPDDDMTFDEYQEIMALLYPELNEEETATVSDATRSDAGAGLVVLPMSSYPSPSDGAISTSVLQYFRDIAVKLPYGMDYVFFRVNDYEYRMVYGEGIEYENGVFTGSALSYVRYYRPDRYNSDWLFDSGNEGTFRLTTKGYLVYSNVGERFPVLNGGVSSYAVYACLFVLVLSLLFNLVHSFFFTGKNRI